ncbi:MAG: protein O-mannosyl-transferase family [Candidatus Velthaea sp.]
MTYRLRSTIAGIAAFAVPLGVYAASLRPGVDWWDTGELQTVPYILGIAHPSGFPAYVLAGWLWSHALTFGDPAYRMNLLSAVALSASCAALVAVAAEWEIEPLFAAGAALVFAFSRVPWDHATHADVHPVAVAAIAVGFWAAARWSRTGSPRALAGCVCASAFALAAHSGMILVVPGIALAALGRRPPLRASLGAIALGAALVAAFYAYLPLRSAVVTAERRDPTLALGVPVGRPFWDNDHPATLAGFAKEVGGGEFGAGHALRSLFDPAVLAELPVRYGRAAIGDLAAGVLIIALAGAVASLRRRPAAALGLLAGGFLPVLFVLAYHAESDPERYFLPSYWVIAVFVAKGADALAAGGLSRPPRAVVALIGALFIFVAGTNVYVGRNFFNARFDRGAQRFVDRVAQSTPDDAVLVAPWMYATPLAYGAYVERRLGRRIVVTGWPQDYLTQYPHWLARRPVIIVSDDETLLRLPGVMYDPPDLPQRSPRLVRLRSAR